MAQEKGKGKGKGWGDSQALSESLPADGCVSGELSTLWLDVPTSRGLSMLENNDWILHGLVAWEILK